jgi:hypothetical protein
MKTRPLLLIVFSFLVSLTVHAYRPTVESLFRNNNNADFAKNSTMLAAKVSKISFNENNLVVESSWHYKYYLTKLSGRDEFLQLTFDKGFNDDQFKRLNYISNFKAKHFFKDKKLLPSLLYSIINMFMQNDSKMILESLRFKGIFLFMNNEKQYQEKIKLLDRYKYYLKRKKEEKLGENEVSPLESADPEKKQKISELLKDSFYKNAEKAKLIRRENKFFWLVERERFKAWFDNETRRLKRIWFKENDLEAEIDFREYVLFNGINELPEYTYIKLSNGENYQIKFTKLINFSDNSTRMYNRLKKYKKLLVSEGEKDENYPWFLLK